MISIDTILNCNTRKARHLSRGPFFNLTSRTAAIIKRCQENNLSNCKEPIIAAADDLSLSNISALSSIKSSNSDLKFTIKDSSPISLIHVPSHQKQGSFDPCSAVVDLNEMADQEARQAAMLSKSTSGSVKNPLNSLTWPVSDSFFHAMT